MTLGVAGIGYGYDIEQAEVREGEEGECRMAVEELVEVEVEEEVVKEFI